MSIELQDKATSNGKPIPTFDQETCKYFINVMQELASISLKGDEYTFNTQFGEIVFKIG